MNILVIGSGGRESMPLLGDWLNLKNVSKVYVAPGNAGTALELPKLENLPIQDSDELATFH